MAPRQWAQRSALPRHAPQPARERPLASLSRQGPRNHIGTARNRLETGLETAMIYIETGRTK